MSYGMKMLSIIVSIFFAIVALIMSAVSYGLYNDNKRLVVKNQLLTELYDVSIKNVEGLEKVIDEQNAKIDKFRSDSITFESRMNDLNATVEKLNNEKETYVKMEASSSGKEEASSDEAMEWLKQQAPSL